ncbi:hypothetical protein NQ318_004369 [Aromia moschata]|uniref:N(6)-adenine-specific DNA methyltransferase 2 n=1 Tax=Aromia moschata TaxID=1265417 RepID=A0AAV8YTQ6_9CUCU|nr:hypothetical protein NQ318_004369 [Aromia moschata]
MSDDDGPELSAETFNALMEFYKEQEERENHQKLISSDIVENNLAFTENWQLSQFWYDEETIDILANVACKITGPHSKIALISCPSLYNKIKHISQDCEINLFEYDKRFAVYGQDFIFYDYKAPLAVSRDKSKYYDLVIADPPFLSEECLT